MNALQKTIQRKRGERGSALLLALLLIMALAAIVIYAVDDTLTNRRSDVTQNNRARAIAAAEYGAELAIAELSAGLKQGADQAGANYMRGPNVPVRGDWVFGTGDGTDTLYRNAEGVAKDQRRIAGMFDDQQFRVQVRSARLAYNNGTAVKGWLKKPDPFVFNNEDYPLYKFSDTYEVTATAMNNNAANHRGPAELASRAVVQAIINFDYYSVGGEFDTIPGVLALSSSEAFQVTGTYNLEANTKSSTFDNRDLGTSTVKRIAGVGDDINDITYTDDEAFKESNANNPSVRPANYKDVYNTPIYNITISGEDHNINKYFVDDFVNNRITTPWKLSTNTANFFGAKGGYWTNGCLTLNYRMEPDATKPNPYRPLTATISSAPNDRKMNIFDTNAVVDEYLLGGKKSKTVTLGSDGLINETADNQANEGGKFNIVLGAFEDLPNLYINMAGITPTNSYPADFTNKDWWFQQYIGQYTNSARSSTLNNRTESQKSIPLLAASKIRAQTLHALLNKDDRKLVREYEWTSKVTGKTTYYPYEATGTEKVNGKNESWTAVWKGNYTWVKCTLGGDGNNTSPAFIIDSGETGAGKVATPRLFFWQELVGYSLMKRGAGGLTGEPALKIMGDGSLDKRTYARTDSEGKKIYDNIGFDEAYQNNPQILSNTDVSKKRSNPGYLIDTADTVWVRVLEDEYNKTTGAVTWHKGDLKPHIKMEDFLFEKQFGVDQYTNEPIIRDALCLFIGYEDQRETQADYNYTDMMFTIYIAPEQKRQIEDIAVLGKTSDQWWERDEREGLTGGTAHVPVSVNPSTDTAGKDDATILAENFALLGHEPKTGSDALTEHIYSMLNPDGVDYSGFPRAIFTKNDQGVSSGVLDFTDKVMAECKEKGITTFYYTKDDLMDFIQNEVAKYYDAQGNQLTAKVIQDIADLNSGYTLKFIDDRWNASNAKSEFQVPANAGDPPSSFLVTKKALSARELAGEIIGYAKQEIPVIQTLGYTVETFEGGSQAQPAMDRLKYIAGEFKQKTPLTSPLTEGLVGDGSIAHRQDELTFPDILENGDNRKGYVQAFVASTVEDAVAMCYKDFYTGDAAGKKAVQDLYGMKEERQSIGFHRSGVGEKYRRRLAQDRFETVSLGLAGFNPYREVVGGSPEYVAKEVKPLPNAAPGSEYDYSPHDYAYNFKYAGDDNLTPTFVFDKPIDGAGAMVINGNLVVKDTFAYYGTLVVLGDVTIIPTLKKDQYVWGSDGNPMDADGRSLRLGVNPDNGKTEWYYIWTDPDNPDRKKESFYILDSDGKVLTDLNEAGKMVEKKYNVFPLKQDVYRGELVVQGNLVVNGRIRTETVDTVRKQVQGDGTVADVIVPMTGKLLLYRSSDAIKYALSSYDQGYRKVTRVSWVHDDNINVDNIWNDKQ